MHTIIIKLLNCAVHDPHAYHDGINIQPQYRLLQIIIYVTEVNIVTLAKHRLRAPL